MNITMETDLPFLSREEDRHGNDRIYVRRNGKRIRIREKERTPAFARAYAEAVEKLGAPKSKPQPTARRRIPKVRSAGSGRNISSRRARTASSSSPRILSVHAATLWRNASGCR
jgi:hypothetical protein